MFNDRDNGSIAGGGLPLAGFFSGRLQVFLTRCWFSPASSQPGGYRFTASD
jgi:hypothetical protein